MKKNFYIFVIFVLLIPLAGEFKFFPFHDSFRVSIGTPIFFFFLLWTRKMPVILPTVVVGAMVVIFRLFLDFNSGINFEFISSFRIIFPSFFYYFTYSILFYLLKVKNYQHRLSILIFLATFIEICSNIIELILRYFILGNNINTVIISQIILLALIRSVFVLGIFSMLKLHEAELEVEHKQRQNSHIISLISNLYEESVALKKSLQDAENITRNCYNLYRDMQSEDFKLSKKELSKKILVIAGEVHDIKKDNQRIYSGISKMISTENPADYMTISEIGDIIINGNRKYAYSLDKSINFNIDIKDDIPMLHVYTTLSLINNLVSNSVEAIKAHGIINITVSKNKDYIEFKVQDNAGGIPKKKLDLIFKPGYTTKYDEYGNSSTGMGLPYVKNLVKNLGGSIEIESSTEIRSTSFMLKLPLESLVKKG
ncbi:sensor histidine kinase GlnK [Clostridium pasteurianum DSM 525 = ATCC 6013]|uniref:histidine kinase n=1 Tax=Clostridium pasteurianum DSM 525 = ATCC 6013 TaxID=1262449 RepID=A0A0H3J2Z2_CLOPA|nr:sensor histidine kinase [Clostridium pasteurianum]AJA47162.1 sensor histidine kinase GlnK [Clostridium pasteurianum DSM 525 = ATCC 6013]AJA51150.1 sensor histidine kinase GlnK [Clostridium pasteurianum DSM 525 = ATCC 6013]AOZ74520.1 histidine kinase [Clostridium pasteurianum DSM 525 = ATCC 6013]AOZ78317.1 histidine kinase [Clostridium pasteurianum]ELP59451.1 sensor histidine kinase [Clostridium pasteurianum DSM 525 = ATCC 6013]